MAEYKSTLNITQTSFPMKANLPQTEPQRLKLWEDWGFHAAHRPKPGAPQYVLHDGPPFANGDIHMGHALNKTLKDIIVKYRSLRGFDAPYVPGWDCHGMPIEHKVIEKLGSKAKAMSKVEIRGECRQYAQKFLERQKEEFKRLGILGDFAHPYQTMDPSYELSLVKALTGLLEKGYVSRRLRPIHWCPVCQTALAEAEVEYADHESLAVTVAFPAKQLPPGILPKTPLDKLSFLIWTTTPWTLPANEGISVHPDFDYASVKVGEAYYVVAKSLLDSVAAQAGWKDYQVVEEARGAQLDRALARHPFLDQDSLVMVGTHVTADTGTGLVHTAPGHGREDYEIGLKYGLPVYSPVNEAGRYDGRVKEYEGQTVWEVNPKIVEKLKGLGRLLSLEKIKHSYPHCWRSKNPILFRATAQWFIELDHLDLRKKCLAEIERVQWIPSWGKDRIHNMVEGRTDWCISRQRSWGVPITAIYCKTCGKVVEDPKVLKSIVALVEKEGIDGWFKHQAPDLLPAGTTCACGSPDFVKEEDILDVWFESGSSHFAVLDQRDELKAGNAPGRFVLYLEGSDQHRGWFQHALWTGVALKGRAPFDGVLTHGWVLDGEGKAMHKSAGNVIDPLEMIKKYGADVLRLWVSSESYTEDVGISEEMLNRMSEAYRRIRNTFRFILGNLSDFDPRSHRVEPKDFMPLDRWAWGEAQKALGAVTEAYDQYQFTRVFHQVDQFFSVSLSAGYFDILKDRLYTFEAGSPGRRAAQTVLYDLLKGFVVAVAPILSFTSEEIWQSLPEGFKSEREKSVFQAAWPKWESGLDEALSREWEDLFAAKKAVLKSLEALRQSKAIGSSLEAEVDLYVGNEKLKERLAKHSENLRYYFLVAQVTLKEGAAPAEAQEAEEGRLKLRTLARKTAGTKCARCWNYYEASQMDAQNPEICHRCGPVVRQAVPGPAA
ncbi:MAG TPA: isoleucine--tRNA ligase [bacterium]|nr:isoleucine--tRNA ligase [bacterium]